MVLVVKNPPANAGDIREVSSSLGGEDPLEEEMATHSSTLAGESHGQKSLVGPCGRTELDMTEVT